MTNPARVSGESVVTGIGSPQTFHNNSNILTAGNVVLLYVASYFPSGVTNAPSSVVDNETVPNTFTRLVGIAPTSLSGCRVDLYASPPLSQTHSAGTSYTVTVTAAAGQTAGCEIGGLLEQWSGFGPLGVAVDVSGTTQTASASSTASVTASGPTSKQAVEAVVAFLHFNDNVTVDGIGTPTGTGTWNLGGAQGNASVGLAFGSGYQVTAATGTTYTATWSGLDTTTNNGGTALIAALYPATSAAVATNATAYTVQCSPGLSVKAPGQPVGGIPPNMSLRATVAAGLLQTNAVLPDGRTVLEAIAAGVQSVPTFATPPPYRG